VSALAALPIIAALPQDVHRVAVAAGSTRSSEVDTARTSRDVLSHVDGLVVSGEVFYWPAMKR